MFENDFMVEFNDEELGKCRTYPKNFKGYEQAIKDLKLYKAKQNQRIAELQKQLAITEKALELACETLQDINFKLYNTEMNFVDFFKQQAKEMLENE